VGDTLVTVQVEHTIEIAAPVERVWALTVDVESWPGTTPTMTKVERLDRGQLRPGCKARVEQPWQRPKIWTVTIVEPQHRFAWTARVFGTDMTATHTLTPSGSGTSNRLTVDLSGRGSGLVGRLLGGQIRKALATENEGFKRAAES
jgi:uncharacterized protein YndB with AHSA1/START domain